MTKDTPKANPILPAHLGPYGELYPSLARRLNEIEQTASPAIRRRIAALQAAREDQHEDRQVKLMRQFGLTRTESRITLHLADGGSVAGYAEMFEVSVGTVRSQLKSIFTKTGVNRQAALASIVPRG
jgi:DNA-binding CsgD family transcriptional regulator